MHACGESHSRSNLKLKNDRFVVKKLADGWFRPHVHGARISTPRRSSRIIRQFPIRSTELKLINLLS
jgi:hypothetical protein